MRWRQLNDIFEIGDRTSDLQHAVIAARREAETICRGLQKRPRFGVDRRVGVEPTADREGVARYPRLFRESVPLSRASSLYPAADRRGRIATASPAQIAEGNGTHGNMHVNSVGQRTRNAGVVAFNVHTAATAGSTRICGSTTRTWIRGADQGEAGWIGHGLGCARDDDLCVLHRLPQSIEHVARKLEHLVEKEYAMVGEAHLTGAR